MPDSVIPTTRGPDNSHNRHNPWAWWRSQMPVTEEFAYFDHAAVAAIPQPAVDAVGLWGSQAARQGGSSWPVWAGKAEELRSGVARWLATSTDEIAFVPNTTAGINLVAQGWPWKSGDNVVIFEHDYPSNRLPWLQLKQLGVEIREVLPAQPGEADPETAVLRRVDAAIDSQTRLVAVSWVGYAEGFRFDLDRLTQLVHQRGAMLFVDAIQGLGVFPLDLTQTPCDFMAADGHKWMLGPEGQGIAFIRREYIDRLHCSTIGWNSVIDRYDFAKNDVRLRPVAGRFEGGTANHPGLIALLAALELQWKIIDRYGANAIAERVLELADALMDRLTSIGAEVYSRWPRVNRSGIVNFNLPGIAPIEVRRYCLQQKIVVNPRGRGVRASVHAFNNEDDIDRLIRALSELKTR